EIGRKPRRIVRLVVDREDRRDEEAALRLDDQATAALRRSHELLHGVDLLLARGRYGEREVERLADAGDRDREDGRVAAAAGGVDQRDVRAIAGAGERADERHREARARRRHDVDRGHAEAVAAAADARIRAAGRV